MKLIDKIAEGIFNEYYPNGYDAAPNYSAAPDSQKANLRRNARAALDVVLKEMESIESAIVARHAFDHAYHNKDETTVKSMQLALKAVARKLKGEK